MICPKCNGRMIEKVTKRGAKIFLCTNYVGSSKFAMNRCVYACKKVEK
jgi:hypothetical protein